MHRSLRGSCRGRCRRRTLFFLSLVVGVAAASSVAGGAIKGAEGTSSTGVSSSGLAAGPKVEVELSNRVAGGKEAVFWVYLADKADLSPAARIADRSARGRFVYERLTQAANRSQAGLLARLQAAGAEYEPFWVANTVRVTGDETLLREIASRPEVEQITADRVYELPEPILAEAEPRVNAVEWGIDRINAPAVWEKFGARGEGIVVGAIDTGALYKHPAIVNQYRGNLGGGAFDHNYNWHDPSKKCGNPSLAPCDNNGHGTHVTGTMVGDDGGQNQIGVAPGAKWIVAKGCETSSCSQGALLSAGQFMLAPTDLNGNNPDPDRRPHIVNNSWGGGATTDPWFQPTVRAWVAAGIYPQFANGNNIPGCAGAGNPGNLPESYSAGAFDINNAIAPFSNRGPSAWGAEIVKPNISAPGVAIRSAWNNGTYRSISGTSMASPHVAGTVALMWSAAVRLRREIAMTRELLDLTAIDTSDSTCGGTPENNNVYGEGRLDAFAAVDRSPRGPAGVLTGTVTDVDGGEPIDGAEVSTSFAATTTDDQGRYRLVLPADTYEVTLSALGYATKTASGVQIADGRTTTLDAALNLKPEWGRVAGTVTGVDCRGEAQPLRAVVDAGGRSYALRLTTGADGTYDLLAPATANPVTLTVSAQGSITATATVYLRVGKTTTGDVTLSRAGCGAWFEPTGFLHPFPVAIEAASLGLSPDGSVAVGRDLSRGRFEATRWTRAGGLIGMGDIPGSPTQNSFATDASNTGVIVGTGAFGTPVQQAFRWTEASGMVGLPGTTGGSGTAVSQDGSVITGYLVLPDSRVQHPFRWTADTGLTDLGLPSGFRGGANAQDISADGKVIVGDGGVAPFGLGAWRWTAADGFTNLGKLGGSFPFTRAMGVSGDGRVIIGNGFGPAGFEAFRWTAAEGIVGLGDLPGGTYSSWANGGISYDGAVIVGGSQSSRYASDAFVWDAVHGMRSLKSLLSDEYGLGLEGWNLEEVQGLSHDGRTMSGWGYNPLGQRGGWVARIPAPTIEAAAQVRGSDTVRLTWTGATSANVDIYRDGAVVATTVNDGSFDATGNRGDTYKVCEPAVQNCSSDVTTR